MFTLELGARGARGGGARSRAAARAEPALPEPQGRGEAAGSRALRPAVKVIGGGGWGHGVAGP